MKKIFGLFRNLMKGKFLLYLLIVSIFGSLGISGAGADQKWKIPNSLLSIENPMKRVKALSERAADLFRSDDFACALFTLDEAAGAIRALKSGQDRAIAGYESKDVVFGALKDGKLTDESIRTKAIHITLQSLSPSGEILPEATSEERINDTSFLFRVAGHFRKEGNVDDGTATLFLMLRLAKTLENPERPYGRDDLSAFSIWFVDASRFSTIVRMLKEMPKDEDRANIIASLMRKLSYDLGIAEKNELFRSDSEKLKREATERTEITLFKFDKSTTLRYADEAEQLMQTILAEPAHRKNIPKSFPFWNYRLYKFIWKSYLVTGEAQLAQQKLDAWIAAIRKLDKWYERLDGLKAAAQDIYKEKVDTQFALSLLEEVEKETMLIEDPKIRKERMELISLSRRWMK